MHHFLDLTKIERQEFSLCLILECFGVLTILFVKIIPLRIKKQLNMNVIRIYESLHTF